MAYEVFLKNIPVIPEVASKVMGITEDKLDISFRELENIIKIDPGLTAKILKVANSALYSRQKEITSLQTAITLLGFKTIKSLVMLLTASSMFSHQRRGKFYKYFWKHSVITAFIAKEIVRKSPHKSRSEDAFLAGLLHDLGQAALYNSQPGKYEQLYQESMTKNEWSKNLENEYFDADHKEVGSEILRSWNFPDLYVDAALEHGSLNVTSPHKQIILRVTAADILSTATAAELPQRKQELLEQLGKFIDLKPDQIEYYTTRYLDDVQEDALFLECRSLFGLNGD
jgi:putative nucleotidyltransferase with HDIG domain